MKKTITTVLILSVLTINSVYAQEEREVADSAKVKFLHRLSDAAIELTKTEVSYDPSYFIIEYPNGDIPANLGVNADVIIRAYRKVNIDLQKEVHEDMEENFDQYPNIWSNTSTDTNIDHRRVPNLQTFFSRKGETLDIDEENDSYQAGDIVIWELSDTTKHIGIVTDQKSSYGTPLVVHNSSSGQRLQNVLFHFKIVGHYRYTGIDPNSEF